MFLSFFVKISFRSGLNDTFHCRYPFRFAFKSEFNSSAEVAALGAMKNSC